MRERAQRNLLISAFLTFIFGTLFGISSKLIVYFAGEKQFTHLRITIMSLSIFYDLTCLSKVWMLFWSSAAIRKGITNCIRYRKFQVREVTNSTRIVVLTNRV
uniref:7TM_GPCR_Srx domain-containing protein n=1 Tax=Rhabditophanes sp. KR3021 TaxID=114890 RepID=A0AC35TMM8_9BILA